MIELYQSANKLILVKPKTFGFDEKSAETNFFQNHNSSKNLLNLATKEHLALKKVLIENNIDFQVLESPKNCPDGIFPNNWIITYADKTYDLFSMLNPNRRLERSKENIDTLQKIYSLKYDYSKYESQNKFLEGTGSLVLDRVNKIAYMAVSKRSSIDLADQWALNRGYKLVYFNTDLNNLPVYHTNVLMFIGTDIAAIGSNLIREKNIENLLKKNHQVISLSEDEILNFCGNCLEIRDRDNKKILLMSSRAYINFTEININLLKDKYPKIVTVNIDNIENIGGGSLRCMLLELF